MHDKLNAEIDKIVQEMAPPANAVGVLTADEVTQVIKQAATKGAMAGWVAGERTARSYWGREIDKLRDHIKELEMDQIAKAKP
jgi:hypothetical protein